ncbi:polysaccharide export outer membrane protein [Nitrosomonas oligotropha]|uniref:Polysaccharide export outer membrane protein n=2 Tax=Nitrosomonas oligotropha TaxID=42354 RepID=A0A2T5H0L3_9PROT|nr:polysaccharide export outer membrane protein [Nitrosomonas oligotropha]
MISVMKTVKILAIVITLLWIGCIGNVVAAEAGESALGPGDALRVFVYGHPDMTTETKVSETGKITFPLLGEIVVDGLTPSAAERKIANLLESRDILRKPQVMIVTASLQSQMVSVLGNVRNQGRYPIEGKRSLTEILAMAGGVVPEGGELVVLIRADGNKFIKEVIDIQDMVRAGDLSKDLIIQSNDFIYVERAPRFYIYGEVQRAGAYRLERDMTVIQALSVGGGLTQRGTERGLKIQRRDTEGNLQIFAPKSSDLVQPDDVIYIKESLF